MPVRTADRPLDSLREEVIDQLILNYGHGELSLEAFERRLESALDAADHDGLQALAADLPRKAEAGFQDTKRRAMGVEDEAEEPRRVEYCMAALGASERSGRWVVPGEVRVVAIMGGVDLDFTRAEFSRRRVRVRLLGIMGGIDIKVPEGVNVEARAFCLLGGFGNKARGQHDPEAPTIIVDGLLFMAGADVKVKRSRKQRLLELADGVRHFYDRQAGAADSPRLQAVEPHSRDH